VTNQRRRGGTLPRVPITTGWGIALACIVAVISGVSVFLNGYAVKQLPDPAVYTTIKNGSAALILVVVALSLVPRARIRSLGRRDWLGMTVVGLIGGGFPFLLFFGGLSIASAPSAAFIHKTLFVWVALLAVPTLGERLGWFPLSAMVVLLAGQFLAAPPTGVSWGPGEAMILAATLLWAVEVLVARRLLVEDVPSPILGAARLSIGLVILVGYLVLTGRLPAVAALSATQWAWAMGTGVLLAAYVGTWLAALRRAEAAVVASVLVIGAPITAALSGLAAGALPPPSAALGFVMMAGAAGGIALVALRSGSRGSVPTG
jgi:drug/metabolite transporter (DMT)-like permease